TVLAQCAMAAVYLHVVVRGARRHGASLRPDLAGIRACAQAGAPLLVRPRSLRAVLMIATAVAARLGDADVAAHQVALTLWSLLAFALDAIAIAGQAIIGRYLGASDETGAWLLYPSHAADELLLVDLGVRRLLHNQHLAFTRLTPPLIHDSSS
ncbi:hypothetical protein DIZ31_26550, partial [Escherichia coli]